MKEPVYLEQSPPPDLTGIVERFWLLTAPPSPPGGGTERILPDGRVELVLNLADPFRRAEEGATEQEQPRRLLVGPTTRHVRVRPTGSVDLVGIRLRPAAAAVLLDPPMHEIRDWTGLPEDAGCRLDRDLCDRLAASGTPAQRLAVTIAAMRRAVGDSAIHPGVRGVCNAIEQTRGRAGVEALARLAGVSRRTLERLFLRHVGLGPKRLARLTRFQATLRRAGRDGTGLLDAALSAGYADQPHFIKDFKEFAGVPPSRWYGREDRLAGDFAASG